MSTIPPTPQSRPTFLVVDDDIMVRKLVARGLTSLNAQDVLEVEDGIQAKQVLETRHVDVVITDVLMPNMDGRELMQWARDNCPHPVFIVLSGLDTFDAAIDALHLGAFDFLAKPPEVQRVQVAVRNALDHLMLTQDRTRLYRELESSNKQLAEKVDQLEDLCHVLEEQAEVIRGDLARAEIIQRALLPQTPPRLGNWCVETLYRSGSYVGGDFYDVVVLDDRHVGIVIADSAGHGVAAAMLSVLFKHRLTLWDNDVQAPLMPEEVLYELNHALCNDMNAPGAFITAAYVLLDRRNNYLRVASAGHPPCLITSPDGTSRTITRTGPALGLEDYARYKESHFTMAPGDRLLLYTDGVLDGGRTAPTRESLLQELKVGERTTLLKDLYNAAIYGNSDDRDDITMILLECTEGASRFDDTELTSTTDALPENEPTGNQADPPPQAQLLKGIDGKHGFLSIAGTGTWVRSTLFYEEAIQLLSRCKDLTIDLGACEYLDSTFLGTLHEIVNMKPEVIRLQRLPPKVRALFEELSMQGVLGHASLAVEQLPQAMEPLSRNGQENNNAEQSRRVLKAHELLASLSEENAAQFNDVVAALKSEVGDSKPE